MFTVFLLGVIVAPQVFGAPFLVSNDDAGLSNVAAIDDGKEHSISSEDNPCKIAWARLSGPVSADGLSALPSLADLSACPLPIDEGISNGGLSVVAGLSDSSSPSSEAGLSEVSSVESDLSGLSSPFNDDGSDRFGMSGKADLSAGTLAPVEENISGSELSNGGPPGKEPIEPLDSGNLVSGLSDSPEQVEEKPHKKDKKHHGHKHKHKKTHGKHKKPVPGPDEPEVESPRQKDYQQ